MTQRLGTRGFDFVLAAAACLSLYAVVAVVVMSGRVPAFELSSARALIAAAFDVAILLLTRWALRRRADFPDPFGRLSSRPVLAGLALFAAWVILYFGTALVAAILFPAFPSARPFHLLTSAPAAILLLLTTATALLEESAVVGYLVSALSPKGAALSIGASTLLRFVCHLYQGPLAAASVIPVGLLFGAVYWRSRNIWPLVVAHSLGSILAFALAGPSSL